MKILLKSSLLMLSFIMSQPKEQIEFQLNTISGVIFNAANEVAVDAFVNKNIHFVDIYKVIQRTFNCFSCSKVSTLDDVFEYDKQARIQAEKVIKSLH